MWLTHLSGGWGLEAFFLFVYDHFHYSGMRDTSRPARHDHVKKGSGDAVINVTCGLLLPSPDAMVASSTGWGEIGRSRESHRGREREKKRRTKIQTRPGIHPSSNISCPTRKYLCG